jgi:spore coat protein U-like protein
MEIHTAGQLMAYLLSRHVASVSIQPSNEESSMNKHARFTTHGLQVALTLLACCSAGSAMAASATATATSTSTVVAPIAIAKAADLAFGSFAASATAGTVTVSPNGARTFTGGVAAAGGTPTAAKFNVTGEAGLTYAITLGGTAQLTSGANTMAFTSISDVTASAITSTNVSSGTLTGGAQSIYVGGVLAVGAAQVAGTYSGTVTATVDYN